MHHTILFLFCASRRARKHTKPRRHTVCTVLTLAHMRTPCSCPITHARTQAYKHTHNKAEIHMQAHTHTNTRIHVKNKKHTDVRIHVKKSMHAHKTHIHAETHTRAKTHIHSHLKNTHSYKHMHTHARTLTARVLLWRATEFRVFLLLLPGGQRGG